MQDQERTNTHTHTHTHIYIYIERERGNDSTIRIPTLDKITKILKSSAYQ